MGLQPTRMNITPRRHPRESGGPPSAQWIPAYAGMTCYSWVDVPKGQSPDIRTPSGNRGDYTLLRMPIDC